MNRIVTRVRFPTGGCELFGRVLRSISAKDGYAMTLHVESGLLTIRDPKEENDEAVVHTSRVDACYLEALPVEEKAPAPKK